MGNDIRLRTNLDRIVRRHAERMRASAVDELAHVVERDRRRVVRRWPVSDRNKPHSRDMFETEVRETERGVVATLRNRADYADDIRTDQLGGRDVDPWEELVVRPARRRARATADALASAAGDEVRRR
jgi:RNase adaptor protein for sRNA GlmZ degradation